jgi:NADH-quinone oxidoreductase subunit J
MAIIFFFYLFSLAAIASSVLVITARNPVHSVLFLILCFFNAAGLFVLLGAEFLAMIVVMMLDVDFVEMREGMAQYLPVGATIGLILLVEMILLVGTWTISPDLIANATSPAADGITNTQAIGQILYTKYVFFFQMAGLILLIAMIGAIVLTMRHKPNVKRQVIADQVARGPATAVEIKDVKSGEGLQ